MRVISGSARGLKLKAPEGLKTRPTADRIKESLFNIIAGDLYDAEFLDCFSGSGGIGIEALSRGASFSAFIDSSRESAQIIRYNLEAAHLSEKSMVINCDVKNAFLLLAKEQRKFDIIFSDPPYDKGITEKTISLIAEYCLLKKGGYIIAEQSVNEDSIFDERFEIFRVKDYKRTSKMTFLRWREQI